MLKVTAYYDVTCALCARSLSTDFKKGMAPSAKEARKWAEEIGFQNISGRNVCPICWGGAVKEDNQHD